MAYFEDLSVCSYFNAARLPTLRAVGWLERGHPYSNGDPGTAVLRRLKEFRRGRWQPVQFLGWHSCDLCNKRGAESWTNMFVPGSGVTYVAPEGIQHYVERHGYHPPREFCDALLASPPVDSREYFESLQALGWSSDFFHDQLVGEPDVADQHEHQWVGLQHRNVLFAPQRHEDLPSNRRLHPAVLVEWLAKLRASRKRRG
jgi:hypothetical protein